ncbi:hypothetical protein J8F10_24185 [Gemmata sp. G18]|uniref:Uncharacterized protein n=1 Tax=Gemmata palustris TaxID=2822762 RepID=A0ABS5BX94_9BACT|nr:hypothetical protein [Gemmata palustris]MBP3958360.1 hypothetical protein [Gemmata palustris]
MTRFEERIEPTKERLDKGDIEIIETDRGGREVRSRRTFWPLNRYFGMKQITRDQKWSGERFSQLFAIGGERSRYSQWKYGVTPGEFDPDGVQKARDEFNAARAAIRGVKEQRIAFEVCCLGERAGRGNLVYLCAALDDLCTHFKGQDDARRTGADRAVQFGAGEEADWNQS